MAACSIPERFAPPTSDASDAVPSTDPDTGAADALTAAKDAADGEAAPPDHPPIGQPEGSTGSTPRTFGTPALPVQITNAAGGCLHLPNGDTTNGAKLDIWTCDPNGVSQTWYMDGNGAIHFGANPAKCIDLPNVRNGVPTDQTQLEIRDCDGSTQDQHWSYEVGNTIINGGKCVELRDGNASDGNPVQIYQCNHTSGQSWSRLLGTRTRPVQLANAGGGCLDLPNGDVTNGTKLVIAACNADGQGQTWYMDGTGAVHYGANPLKCVDLPRGDASDRTPIQLWDCDNGSSVDQLWSYEGDETIQKEGKCVETQNGISSDGTPIQINPCHGYPGQHWVPRQPH